MVLALLQTCHIMLLSDTIYYSISQVGIHMLESFPRRWDRANRSCRHRGRRAGRHDCDVGMRSPVARTLLSLCWIVRVGRTLFHASITRHRLGRAANRASPMEIEQKWKLEDRILSTQKTRIPSFRYPRRLWRRRCQSVKPIEENDRVNLWTHTCVIRPPALWWWPSKGVPPT